jgi:hypothetical protein
MNKKGDLKKIFLITIMLMVLAAIMVFGIPSVTEIDNNISLPNFTNSVSEEINLTVIVATETDINQTFVNYSNSFINLTNVSISNYTANFSMNKFGITADGTYTFSLTVVNASEDGNRTKNFTIVLDTIAPRITSFTVNGSSILWLNSTINGTNVNFTATVSENYLVNISINATGTNFSENLSATGVANEYSLEINTSILGAISEGNNTVSIVANDSASNANTSEVVYVMIDTAAPTAATILTSTNNTDHTSTLGVNASDALDTELDYFLWVNGTRTTNASTNTIKQTNGSITISGLVSGKDYNITLEVEDNVGNKVNATDYILSYYFTVATTSGGSGGGSSSSSSTVYQAVITESAKTYSALARGDKVQFSIGGNSHSVTVKTIASDRKSATIIVASEPQTITLDIGQIKVIDIDGEEISIKLLAINNRKADLEITKISDKEKIPLVTFPAKEEPVVEEAPAEEPVEEAPAEPAEEAKTPIIGWVIAAIVIIVALAAYFVIAKKKKA